MSRAREEGGWTLVIALMLMAIMASMALATFAFVDRQQEESGNTRKRETAYNLAEGILNAQIYTLSTDWAGYGKESNPYVPCTQGSSGSRCPSTATISGLFASPDTASGMTWRTEVHDNTGPNSSSPNSSFYSETTTRTNPPIGYDRNRDNKLWVRAQATARGKTRTLVALVSPQEQVEDMPRGAVITGRLDISNNGHKVIIDASAGSSTSGLVAVRCTPALLETEPCLGHKLGGGLLSSELASLNGLLNFQISPNVTVTGYASTPSLAVDARERLKARAAADGNYYATCPPSLPAGVVYIETGTCSYNDNSVVNSPTAPGVVIMANGTLTLRGTIKYYGIIYHANLGASVADAVDLGGNVQVHGGVLVDGQATTIAGSSKVNVQLDLDAYNAVKSYGSAGIIQNTFREIKGA